MLNQPAMYSISQKRKIFTLEEANSIFPLVFKITKQSYDKLNLLKLRGSYLRTGSKDLVELETQAELVVSQWTTKMRSLGVVVKDLWLLDFDCGYGYFCWRYPEVCVEHFHLYSETFQNRKTLNVSYLIELERSGRTASLQLMLNPNGETFEQFQHQAVSAHLPPNSAANTTSSSPSAPTSSASAAVAQSSIQPKIESINRVFKQSADVLSLSEFRKKQVLESSPNQDPR